MKKVYVLIGNYGSGKTELALNAAFESRAAGHETALVDLDIVNPFFRSAELGDALRREGIALYAPDFALTAADIPVLPAEILSVFENERLRVFFDVGGDDAGAAALGRYHRHFEKTGYDLLLAVNPYRPRSATPGAVADLIARVEDRARLRVTHLINNANLAEETTAAHLRAGESLLEAVREKTGLPILCVSGDARLADAAKTLAAPFVPIRRYLLREWMDGSPR